MSYLFEDFVHARYHRLAGEMKFLRLRFVEPRDGEMGIEPRIIKKSVERKDKALPF